jgi:hypothetical protein
MKKDLEEIKKHIARGQAALRDLQCSLLFEVYRKYNTNRSLKYLSGEELKHLPEFIECMIITSRQVGPFLNHHPMASNFKVASPLGDMASSTTAHDDVSFSSRMSRRGFTVDANSRGLYDWKDRSIHLQMGAALGHAIHEGIHSFSSFGTEIPVFLSTLGSFLYEGVTQVFTDQVLADFQWDAANHGYHDEVGCAQKFMRDFTPMAVASAYFRRQIVPLAEAVARKLGINLNDLRIMKDVKTDGRSGRHLCEKLGYI